MNVSYISFVKNTVVDSIFYLMAKKSKIQLFMIGKSKTFF